MALALPENGTIVALDRVERTMDLAKGYAESAGVQHKVELVLT